MTHGCRHKISLDAKQMLRTIADFIFHKDREQEKRRYCSQDETQEPKDQAKFELC
jgi:hypothetical protein